MADYSKARPPDLGIDLNFRFWALHAGSGKKYALTRVEHATWDDSSAILSGEIAVRVPLGEGPSPEMRLDQGDRIICEANEGQGWIEVWRMRCYTPQLAASNMARTFKLLNDLDLLRQSEDNFLYHNDRTHKHGWTGPDVIRDVCHRYKVTLGKLYTSSRPVGKLHVRRGSPLEVIRNVLKREKRHGKRLFVRYDKGRLNVIPLQRNPQLIALGPTLIEAAFQSELRPEFGSAVTLHSIPDLISGAQDIHGRVKGKVQKGHVEQRNQKSIELFGFVHRIVFSPDATTDALLLKESKAWLAAVTAPHKTLTVSHRGMPWLRRGDAIQLALGDEGLKRQIVWVNQVQHSVSPTGYTSDITVIFDDPYRNMTEENVLFRLKSTKDEAIGDRARNNPLWNFPPNNKADAQPNTSQPNFTTPTTIEGSAAGPNDPGGLNTPNFGG